MSKYIINNKKGCTVTIMVPWDCENACAFCVNKCEYKDGFDIERAMDEILKSIETMHEITPACDFVITGGEPFADCSRLVDIVEAIPNSHNIYINTTLPVLYKRNIFNFVRDHSDRISCINISRHIWTPVDGANDKFLKRIANYVDVRINSVVPNWVEPTDKNFAMFGDFMERFFGFNIQIRSDYRDVTTKDIENYKENPVYVFLKSAGAYEKWKREEVNRIGITMEFFGAPLTWHLTCDYSKVETENGLELVDVIINQNGDIMDDWNGYGAPLDLDGYKEEFYE